MADAIPLFLAQKARGIQREVPALGVPADEPASAWPNAFLRVVQRQFLRFRAGEADHAVFFPGCEGTVCPPESYEGKILIVVKAHGRELQGRVLPYRVNIVADAQIAEPSGIRRVAQQFRKPLVAAGNHDADRSILDHLPAVPDLPAVRTVGKHGRQIEIGQSAENQSVFVAESGHGNREIRHPLNVITQVIHGFLLCTEMSSAASPQSRLAIMTTSARYSRSPSSFAVLSISRYTMRTGFSKKPRTVSTSF